MVPVEIVFLVTTCIFGVVGIVRGYSRELGVTTMLLLALFVLELIGERYPTQWAMVLGKLFGSDPETLLSASALIYSGFLIVIVFISYHGNTLTFPGKGDNWFFSLDIGLLNGYLFAGSLWYYLETAGWPIVSAIVPNYTSFNQAAMKLLPPAIFTWPYLILLAVFMLIIRVWK
jgi:hypothetical protein